MEMPEQVKLEGVVKTYTGEEDKEFVEKLTELMEEHRVNYVCVWWPRFIPEPEPEPVEEPLEERPTDEELEAIEREETGDEVGIDRNAKP